MLPKKNRADRKQIVQIFKEGRFLNSGNLTFKYTSPPAPSPEKERGRISNVQISFIAPKSVAKLAVKRNLLRRRGYSALSKYIGQFPTGTIGAFIFKKPINSVLEIENEIKTILHKIN
jgi:ribonuclease P protein component